MRTLIGILVGLACSSGQVVASDYDADSIKALIADLETATETFSVECVSEIDQRADAEPSGFVELQCDAQITVDALGRVRYASRGTNFRRATAGELVIYPEKVLAVFDGSMLYSMSGGAGDFLQGIVSNERSEIPWRFNPRNVIAYYYDIPISEHAQRYGLVLVDQSELENRRLIRLDTRPTINNGAEWKHSFVVDVGRGCAVVKRAALVRSPGKDWIEFTRIETSDHKEIEAGVWLPGAATYESFNVNETGLNEADPIAWRHRMTFREWNLNPDVSEAVFSLDFPSGLFINDRANGRTYMVEHVSDQLLADQVAGARRVQTALKTNQWMKWLGIAVGVLLLGVFAWRVLKHLRTAPR